jgi:hypothetical protein
LVTMVNYLAEIVLTIHNSLNGILNLFYLHAWG